MHLRQVCQYTYKTVFIGMFQKCGPSSCYRRKHPGQRNAIIRRSSVNGIKLLHDSIQYSIQTNSQNFIKFIAAQNGQKLKSEVA